MAPSISQLGLVFLATASVALAQPHGHGAGHRHVRRSQTYVSAPYGFSNGTVSAVPTGAAPVPDETTTAYEADETTVADVADETTTTYVAAAETTAANYDADETTSASVSPVTSTRTETLTSYITHTITADDGEATDAADVVAVSNANVAVCGATQYVTVTESVTVTAAAEEAASEETVVPETATSTVAPVTEAAAYVAPAAESTASAEPTTSAEPITAATTTAEPITYESASSSSSSSAAAATTTGYSGGNTGSTGLRTKRGCLYEYGKNDCAELAAQGQLSWITNWAPVSDSNDSGMTFIPQLWGQKSADGSHDYTTNWVSDCQKALDAGSPAILGFNEPDIASQADLTPAVAAQVWSEQISGPFGASGKILVSPGVTSTQSNGVFPGLDWLTSFEAAGASWDATAVHMYANCNLDAADQVTYLKNMVDGAVTRFAKPVWVTEFGCDPASGGSAAQQSAFIAAAIAYLEAEDSVKQYAAFKADTLAGSAAGTTYATLASTAST